MSLLPYPGLAQLVNRMRTLADIQQPWQGITYRSATPRYATTVDQISGVGSKRHGGRWNPVGIAAIYSSLTPETAMAETFATARYFDMPTHAILPRTFVALQLRLTKVIDLTHGTIRQRLHVSRERMIQTDWRQLLDKDFEPITQAVGRAAVAAGYEAILVPSAADRPHGVNIVVYPENLAATSCATVIAGVG